METSLKVRIWEDEYRDLCSLIDLDYDTAQNYMTDEGTRERVDKIVDMLFRYNSISNFEDLYYAHCEHTYDIVTQIASLLCNNEEGFKETYMRADQNERDEMVDNLITDIMDQMSYSGELDRTELLSLSCILRRINLLITNDDIREYFSIDINIPPDIVLSVGDAQNCLFPQFLAKTNAEICESAGYLSFALDEPIDLRLTAFRKPNNNLQIGGETSWQH